MNENLGNIPVESFAQIAEILSAPRAPRRPFEIIIVNRSAGHLQPLMTKFERNFDFVRVRVLAPCMNIVGLRPDLIILESRMHTDEELRWYSDLMLRRLPHTLVRSF